MDRTSHRVEQMTTAEIFEAATRTSNAGPFTIGAQSNTLGDTAKFFRGKIGEVMMFNGLLDVATANSFCTSMASKWCVKSGDYCKPQPLATLSGNLPQRNKLSYHISTDGDFQNLPLGTVVNQLLDESPSGRVFNVESSLCSGAEVVASNQIDRKLLRFGRLGATCYRPSDYYVWHQSNSGFEYWIVASSFSDTNTKGIFVSFGRVAEAGFTIGVAQTHIRFWLPTGHGGVQQSWQNPTSNSLMVVRVRAEFGSSSTKQQIYLNGELKDEVTSTLPELGPNQIDHAQVTSNLKGPYLIGLQSKVRPFTPK